MPKYDGSHAFSRPDKDHKTPSPSWESPTTTQENGPQQRGQDAAYAREAANRKLAEERASNRKKAFFPDE